MNSQIACIIIATAKRASLIAKSVMPSAITQGFDDVVVVGDWPAGDGVVDVRVRYLHVEPMLRNTVDALVKRDVGTLATTADTLIYLCDDHALGVGFADAVRDVLDDPWDVIVPNRRVHLNDEDMPLNNGEPVTVTGILSGQVAGYCGGHCGIYRRSVVTAMPWSAGPHHPNWDTLISYYQQDRGARYVFRPRLELTVWDLEPERKPWAH